MSKKEIIKGFRLAATLMELHQENPFKIRGYQNAIAALERAEIADDDLTAASLIASGLTDNMAGKALSLLRSGTFQELEELKAKTPPGVIEMLSIKGLGAKKVQAIWQELGITTLYELAEACQAGKIATLKGFGEKTQARILEQIAFLQSNQGKILYAEAETLAAHLLKAVQEKVAPLKAELTGQVARCWEVIDCLQVTAAVSNVELAFENWVHNNPLVETDLVACSPFVWRGWLLDPHNAHRLIAAQIHWTSLENFPVVTLKNTASPLHLSALGFLELIKKQTAFESVESIYQALGVPFVPAELREGSFEVLLAKQQSLPTLVTWNDLKGTLHNHSTYSDGKDSLRQMAQAAHLMGLQYFGIADHSVSAYYANGLTIEQIKQQHREIDQLNRELAPFRILKGIEADILADGSLDYPEEILATFDYVVASVHSGLKMDISKATQRLIKAIENPYTTILGHPTGRLLLRREGYPIDYEAVISACAAHQVAIEINANPWRLDLDWRWVRRAIEAGCLLCINPDAHETEGLYHMRYGLLMARKGGAESRHILNAFSLEQLQDWLSRRKRIGQKG
ncbi:MAG: PHP domain-containing protein [Cytophagales bacterium]|nr:PHP domain-containing protein [Bernardetiaceae bacterium]MDW8210060.1 PHP domain-containing protein [Cytophagales bacterium]